MNFRELLKLINYYAIQMKIPPVYLVGGVPRDKVAGKLATIKDIDLTNGSDTIHQLADKLNIELDYLQPKIKKYPDSHISLEFSNLTLDFSSNFIIPEVDKYAGKPLSSLEKEVYSRDFTCNTLLWDLGLQEIIDLTGKGEDDIAAKVLRTCLAPEITLTADPKRVARLLYLAAKLNFYPTSEILKYLSEHPELQTKLDQSYLFDKLSQAYVKNKPHTLELLKNIGWNYLIGIINV